ncbi:MAG: hypothetical protein QW838_04240 [Candidatus Nitrosotenuis sp.]
MGAVPPPPGLFPQEPEPAPIAGQTPREIATFAARPEEMVFGAEIERAGKRWIVLDVLEEERQVRAVELLPGENANDALRFLLTPPEAEETEQAALTQPAPAKGQAQPRGAALAPQDLEEELG